MKILPIGIYNNVSMTNKKTNNQTNSINLKTTPLSENISFTGGFELGLKLKSLIYARKARKILADAKEVRISQYEVMDKAFELQKRGREIYDEARYLHSYAKALEYQEEITPDDPIYELAEEVARREYNTDEPGEVTIEEYDDDDLLIREIVIGEETICIFNYDIKDNQDEVYVMEKEADCLTRYEKGNDMFLFYKCKLKNVLLGHEASKGKYSIKTNRAFYFEDGEFVRHEKRTSDALKKPYRVESVSLFNARGLKEYMENISDSNGIKTYDVKYTFNTETKEPETCSKQGEIKGSEYEFCKTKYKFSYGKLADVLEDDLKQRDLTASSPLVFRYKNDELVSCLLDYEYSDDRLNFYERAASTVCF